MGGGGVAVSVPACVSFLASNPDVSFLLVGDKPQIQSMLSKHKSSNHERITIEHTNEVVDDHDTVAHALRNKKHSSMRLAINAVKDGRAQACVSGGNTGALMAISRFVLKMLPGIDRPAIIAKFPSYDLEQGVYMLDLGANVDSPPEALLQFAMMGSVLASAQDGIERPRVALLNIGEESHKGNPVIQESAVLLEQNPSIHYIGFIEPNMIYSDVADVIVCDGFIGNIALKSIEGTARVIKHFMRSAYEATWFNRFLSVISGSVINRMRHSMSTSRRNGATFVGLNGIVIKSHGDANIKGFANAIKNAYDEINLAIKCIVNFYFNLLAIVASDSNFSTAFSNR